MARVKSLGTANALWLGLTGLSIGWLVGLARSPVLGTVLAGILPLTAAFVAITGRVRLKGMREEESGEQPKPPLIAAVALLAIGLAMGATAGLHYRVAGTDGVRALDGSANSDFGLYTRPEHKQMVLPCTNLEGLTTPQEVLEYLRREPPPWGNLAQYIQSESDQEQRTTIKFLLHALKDCQ